MVCPPAQLFPPNALTLYVSLFFYSIVIVASIIVIIAQTRSPYNIFFSFSFVFSTPVPCLDVSKGVLSLRVGPGKLRSSMRDPYLNIFRNSMATFGAKNGTNNK